MNCPRCGKYVKAEKYCSSCGANLQNKRKTGQNKNINETENVNEELVDLYIGINKESIKKGGFSFWAFIFGPLYYFYRKMYKEGWIYYLIYFILIIIDLKTIPLTICISLYSGYSFKKHYIRHAQKKVKEILKYNNRRHQQDIYQEITRHGGTTWMPIIILLSLIIFTFLVIILAPTLDMSEDRNTKNNNFNVPSLIYEIPNGFKPNAGNNDYYASYSTENSECSFFVYQKYKQSNNTSHKDKIESLALNNDESNSQTTELINGAFWTINIQIKANSKTYNLKTENQYAEYGMSYFYLTENENSYCEEAYNTLKESLTLK